MAFKRGGEDKVVIAVIACVVFFGALGIMAGGETDADSASNDTSQLEAQQAAQEEQSVEQLPGILITREEYGDAWPFTSDEGRIECRRGGALVFVVRDFEYQLNGLAEQMGYTKINSIWRWNPDIPGARVSLTPIIQRAKSLC